MFKQHEVCTEQEKEPKTLDYFEINTRKNAKSYKILTTTPNTESRAYIFPTLSRPGFDFDLDFESLVIGILGRIIIRTCFKSKNALG